MNNTSYIETLHFGYVPVRRNHTEGEEMKFIYLAGDDFNWYGASIRKDTRTNQPFAVIFNGDLEEV